MSDPISLMLSPITGIFKGMERLLNSSEHNFKSDLDDLLAGQVPDELRGRIKDFLNKGRDEDIGEKIQALMASGIIPPELQPQIMALAEKNGVPRSSFDPEQVQQEMSVEEIRSTIGGDFSNELDQAENDQESERTEAGEEDGEDGTGDPFQEFQDKRYYGAE